MQARQEFHKSKTIIWELSCQNVQMTTPESLHWNRFDGLKIQKNQNEAINTTRPIKQNRIDKIEIIKLKQRIQCNRIWACSPGHWKSLEVTPSSACLPLFSRARQTFVPKAKSYKSKKFMTDMWVTEQGRGEHREGEGWEECVHVMPIWIILLVSQVVRNHSKRSLSSSTRARPSVFGNRPFWTRHCCHLIHHSHLLNLEPASPLLNLNTIPPEFSAGQQCAQIN